MCPKARLVIALLAVLLVTATEASSQTKACECAAASLMGDTVTTQFGGGPAANRTVNAGVELPNAGPVLGAAGSSPRWNIDFGNDTIRVDFLQQPATYGAGAAFVFTGLDPQLAGCPPPFISGINVTTNKPTSPFNVVANATYGPHSVTVQIAPTGGNLDWMPGEFILVRLKFACETPPPSNQTDPCCPPWNKELLKSMLFYQGQGSISAPYTLKFQPTAAFKGQMQAYINYLNSINPAMNAITIDWRLHDQGTNATPNPPYGPQVGPTVYTTWNTTTAGNPVFTHPNFFNLPTPFPMQVGRWYMVHTGIYLEKGQKFFPDKCANNEIYVRVQALNAKGKGGASVLEFSDGGQVLQSVPLDERREQPQR